MRNVILAVQSSDILAALTALHVWGEETGFEIVAVAGNTDILDKMTDVRQFDLLIIETGLAAKNNFQIIKKIINNGSCEYIAFCGGKGDFYSAREGIRLGIKEYFTSPYEPKSFLKVFESISAGARTSRVNMTKFVKELVYFFERQDSDIYEFLEQFAEKPYFSEILDMAIEEIFNKNDWLDLYFDEDFFCSKNVLDIRRQKEHFVHLYESVCKLYPHHTDLLKEVILHILYNPESDLRQATLSEELHVNQST